MKTLSVHTDSIEIGERHRPLDPAAISRLAGSIKDIGLQQPITIRVVDMMVLDGQEVEGVPVLVAGHHRLAAAKALGWSHIECIEIDDDALKAELWEIDENLMRAELTASQEAEHLSRRKRIWKAINKGGKTVPTPGGKQRVEFAADTAASVGQTKRAVNAKIARADKIGPDLHLIAGTSLDKGVEMDALAKMDAGERHALAARAAAGEKVSAIPVEDVNAKQLKALMSAWNRAGADARQLFLDEIDAPVFDRTRAGAA